MAGDFSIEIHWAANATLPERANSLVVAPGTDLAVALSRISHQSGLSVATLLRAAIAHWLISTDRKGQGAS
jgi:hypothetical protein